jgi:transposase
LLRKIDSHIDLNFVRELTEPFYCQNNGRPSIDPEIFFRTILIGYLYGIDSDRQLCDEIQYNLAYRWFCKLRLEDKVIDHSSLTRIRDRFGLDTFNRLGSDSPTLG